MSDIAIEVSNLSKRYRIGLKEELHDTFIGSVASWLKSPISNYKKVKSLASFSDNGKSDDVLWALEDISFRIEKGEIIGIIGENGAGKTTLLKILSRITEPTSGYVKINGSVSSLLEVGTGFHPELTGRENVFLNGVILGMKHGEINRKFDEIVDFSGVEKFIDTPVKRYSSGMRVRLAFSVAAHLEPNILLVDEVLAVGDAAFQKKCLGKMDEIGELGRTVILVSHNMNSIGKLCNRGILLSNGKIAFDGPVSETINQYLQGVSKNESAETLFPDNEKIVTINSITILDQDKKPNTQLERSQPFSVEVKYTVKQKTYNIFVSFNLSTLNGSVKVLNAREEEDVNVSNQVKYPGVYLTTLTFPGGLINIGTYQIRIGITKNIKPSIDKQEGPNFDILDTINGDFRAAISPHKRGILSIGLKWETESSLC